MSATKSERETSESNIQLGKRIRSLRGARNLSQEQLANRANMSAKYLGEVERGKGNISVEKLHKLAAAPHVSLNELIDSELERTNEDLLAEISRMVQLLTRKDAQIIYRTMKIMTDGKF